jgi:hypothetical protein
LEFHHGSHQIGRKVGGILVSCHQVQEGHFLGAVSQAGNVKKLVVVADFLLDEATFSHSVKGEHAFSQRGEPSGLRKEMAHSLDVDIVEKEAVRQQLVLSPRAGL